MRERIMPGITVHDQRLGRGLSNSSSDSSRRGKRTHRHEDMADQLKRWATHIICMIGVLSADRKFEFQIEEGNKGQRARYSV
jgi:hypothetical protein